MQLCARRRLHGAPQLFCEHVSALSWAASDQASSSSELAFRLDAREGVMRPWEQFLDLRSLSISTASGVGAPGAVGFSGPTRRLRSPANPDSVEPGVAISRGCAREVNFAGDR